MSYNPAIQNDSSNTAYTTVGGKQYKVSRVPIVQIATDALITRRFMGKNPFWVRGLDKTVAAGRRGYRYYRSARRIPHIRKRYIPFLPWFARGPSQKSVQQTSYQFNQEYSGFNNYRSGGRYYKYCRHRCVCKRLYRRKQRSAYWR